MSNTAIKNIIIGVLIYAVTTVGSYAVLAKSGSTSSQSYSPPSMKDGTTAFDDSLPKTQPCPINGQKFSKQQEAWWQQHRPLGVMIENTPDARPQSGLSHADTVYEAPAEGGITRFLAVFYCQDAGEVGPVRSARVYYLNFISEYGDHPLYGHVGGANTPGPANALGMIDDWGWTNYNDLSEFGIGCPVYCRIENHNGREVATEHTMYSSSNKLWGIAKQRGLTQIDKSGTAWDANFVKYTFKDDAPLNQRPSSQNIQVVIWPNAGSDYTIDWKYDRTSNSYLRSEGGAPHIDRNTKKQIAAKTIVDLSMVESNANDGYTDNEHLLFDQTGTGTATIFMDGKEIKGIWSKDSRTARTIISDQSGNQIQFNRGLIWFQVVPSQIGNITLQ